KVNVAPTRSVNLRSLATVASRFHRFKPRRFPTLPQLVSIPRTQRRKLAKTEAGSAKMLTWLELFVPTLTLTPLIAITDPATPVWAAWPAVKGVSGRGLSNVLRELAVLHISPNP